MQKIVSHIKQQADIVKLFDEKKLPHAFLLWGQKGVGKRLFADQLARLIICGKSSNSTSQDFSVINTSSDLFEQIESGSLSEFKVIESDGSIKVETLRLLIKDLSKSSDLPKVVIIDSIDDLTIGASNALLKTLEEPSLNTFIILISHKLSNILPTIVSRCRKIKFNDLTNENLFDILSNFNIDKTKIENSISIGLNSPAKIIEDVDLYIDISKNLDDIFNNKQVDIDSLLANYTKENSKKFLDVLKSKTYNYSLANINTKKGLFLSEYYAEIIKIEQNISEININVSLSLNYLIDKLQKGLIINA